LTEPVADRLRKLLDEIAVQNGFELLACEVMPDHVHLFVSAPPRYSPSTLAKLFKDITSRRLRQELGEQLRRKVWKPGILWSPSYYAGAAGNVSGDVIKHYIEECQHI
jgi:putative transposase